MNGCSNHGNNPVPTDDPGENLDYLADFSRFPVSVLELV